MKKLVDVKPKADNLVTSSRRCSFQLAFITYQPTNLPTYHV